MKIQELLIEIGSDEIEICVIIDGFDVRRTVLSRHKEGEALTAWLKKYVEGSAYARMKVAGVGDMRLALNLARMLARAGHTVSVGNICRFRPAQGTEREDLAESPSFEESRQELVDMR